MIGKRLVEVARAQPDAPALVIADAISHTTVSYAELLAAGNGIRRRLEAMRVERGDIVVVALPVRPEAVTTFAGCALMGAIYLAVNPSWSQAEIEWLIPRVNPSAVVIVAKDRDLWKAAGLSEDRILTPDEIYGLADDAQAEAAVLPPDHAVAYQLSSGSTGQPKIVIKSGGRFLESMLTVASVVGLRPGRRLLASAPFHFGFSFSWNMLLPLVSGATIVVLERFEPSIAAEVIVRHQVDCLWGSPILYSLLTDAGLEAGSLARIQINFTGGAAISPAVKREWKRLSGRELRQAYGTTEAGMIAIQPEELVPDGCVGLPPPGTELRILVGSEPQPPGVTGEIAVRGPGVMAGFLDDPEATAAPQQDGFLRTGDAGWLDEQGRLYLAGRIRPWINAGGVKIDPMEVQNSIRCMPGVRDCLVQPEPGPRGIDLVAAVIVPEPGATLTRADVIWHCRQSLAGYKIPRRISFVDALASDLTGKAVIKRPWARFS